MIKQYIASGPTLAAFHDSDDFVRSIRGPIGSGKSTACCVEILKRAYQQEPGPDGRRHTRWAIIRNTYGELRTTTIRTWTMWLPESVGRFSLDQPPSPRLVTDTLDFEVLFLALDRPEDSKKLLSLELTGAWINEAREVPKAILDALTGRVGRYPPMEPVGPTWSGVLLDTMSPDTDHWMYRLAEEETPEDWRFFAQPAGDGPDAENRGHLPANYSDRLRAGKSEEWIRVYIKGEYGYDTDNKPVYPEYKDSVHCAGEPLEPIKGLPISIGSDFGLTPASVMAQRTATGQWRFIAELVSEDMGAVRHAEHLSAMLDEWFPDFQFRGWGDPAGGQRSQVDERTALQIMSEYTDIEFRSAPTNEFLLRREAVAGALNRMIDGQPGFLISPACKVTRKGMAGSYHFKRVQVSGDERFHDVPNKNRYSHPCEAVQYVMLGGGEGRVVMRKHARRPTNNPPRSDMGTYSPFAW